MTGPVGDAIGALASLAGTSLDQLARVAAGAWQWISGNPQGRDPGTGPNAAAVGGNVLQGPEAFRDLLLPDFVAGVSDAFAGFSTVGALVIVTGLPLVILAGARRKRRRTRVLPRVLQGKAYVTDGDGVRVQGREVRFAALDAPEWDQRAQHRDGYWFGHGKRVKSALISEIGGRHVRVAVEAWDRFGRAVGTVTCEGRDIGRWLVSEGHAIAANGDRYKSTEADARKACRGMWAHKRNVDPRVWRHSCKKRATSWIRMSPWSRT